MVQTDLERALDRLKIAHETHAKRKRRRALYTREKPIPSVKPRLPYKDDESRHVWNDGDPLDRPD